MDNSLGWEEFRSEVLSLYKPPLRRIATLRKIRQVLDQFGAICQTTRDLSPTSVARWRVDHSRYRPATVRSMLSALRAIANYGASRHYLDSPFAFRSLKGWLQDLEEGEPLQRHHSAAEIGKVLARADAEASLGSWRARRLRALVHTLAFTAGRAGEILGLYEGDIDLAARIIRIRPNDRRKLKSRASRRELPISRQLLPILEAWLGRNDSASDWVFPHSRLSGPWLYGTEESRALGHVSALGARAGVPGLTLLSFRHSFASCADAWGWGELALMDYLGHSRPQTQRTYRHRDPERLRPAADAVRF